MPQHSGSADLASTFLALHEQLTAGANLESVGQRLIELAVDSVPGCHWAAITVWTRWRGPHSLVCSADVAQAVDQLQYDHGEGPCLSAAATNEPFDIRDLTADQRWPTFTAAARTQTPVRGVLSIPLGEAPDPSALNLYSSQPGAFDHDATAAVFATHARVLLLHAHSIEQASHLSQALHTSRQIGTAVGIVMTRHEVSAEDAFQFLASASQNQNRKLSLIAEQVTRTGQLPEPVLRRPLARVASFTAHAGTACAGRTEGFWPTG